MRTLSDVPNKPATRISSFRIPDWIKEPAQEVAAEQGESLTDVVNRALIGYARSHGRDVQPPSPPSSSSP